MKEDDILEGWVVQHEKGDWLVIQDLDGVFWEALRKV